MTDLVIGIDVGSQGARALVTDAGGTVVGAGAARWGAVDLVHGRNEQDPERWMTGVMSAMSQALRNLDAATRARVRAIAPTSTSGTLVLCDARGRPVMPAIMWSDTRASLEAEDSSVHLQEFTQHTGLRMRGSFPLPKLMWLARHSPELLASAAHIMHASDYLLWHLGLGRAVTDPTNALKTGYDIVESRWDRYLDDLGVIDRLPSVTPSGRTLGRIDLRVAETLGLGRDVELVGTMTDSNTATLAAGVVRPGQWVTTLGTGMSVKGVAAEQLIDPTGSVYSHVDPRGLWLPSGTSHLGAAAVSARFGDQLGELTILAEKRKPGSMLVYPLLGRGDFFPQWRPDAQGFSVGEGDVVDQFRATLEGIAVVEELSFRKFSELGADVGDTIASVGGATRSPLWNTIRASIQGRAIRTFDNPETAVGAAVLAFAALGHDVNTLADAMATASTIVEPDPVLTTSYDGLVERYSEVLDGPSPTN